jgi:hypothetical protein
LADINLKKKMFPIGIENFPELIKNDYYYVDKTDLIFDITKNINKVTLYTRPRRFGKTLNMSMLKSFFEVDCDKSLFDGLKVSENKEICEKHMGKYPVIFISLKSVDGLDFNTARNGLVGIIRNEASRFDFLTYSSRLDELDKKDYNKIKALDPISIKANPEIVSENDYYLTNSLKILSTLLEKHFGQKTVILIDEYDVPLDKAHQSGFYREMVTLIRNLLGNVLKTNDSLAFAVLTGCLRISKESIFTGLNNLAVKTITDKTPGAYFGFTEKEVAEMLAYYDMADQSDLVREWYDGYKFGASYMYCPWDVINFCCDLNNAREADLNHDTDGKNAREFLLKPKNYWINTSGNTLIRSFIDKANGATKQELEQLVAGEYVYKKVNETLTYDELYNSIDNLWSVLFTTGYLTADEVLPDGRLKLRIPNNEVREVYIEQIQEWFKKIVEKDHGLLKDICTAFFLGNAEKIETKLNECLWKSISIRDSAGRKSYRENFYHGILLGILQYEEDWIVISNKESGTGYPDLLIETPERTGIVIELKYAESGDLEKACDEALLQIEEKKYEEIPRRDRMKKVIKYGIAFYKKDCMVKMSRQ